jgi:hypothetical protein
MMFRGYDEAGFEAVRLEFSSAVPPRSNFTVLSTCRERVAKAAR